MSLPSYTLKETLDCNTYVTSDCMEYSSGARYYSENDVEIKDNCTSSNYKI
jgi:hypothetical protein